MDDVSRILWRERQLLEILQFKLEEEQLLLAAGRARWLAHAAREIESVLEQVRSAELMRAVAVDAVAEELGLAPGPTLRQLVAAAPPPWSAILGDHRRSFLAAAQELTAIAEANRELLGHSQRAVREALAWMSGPEVETYTPEGATRHGGNSSLLDEAL